MASQLFPPLGDATDIHLFSEDITQSRIYPGERTVTDNEVRVCEELLTLCRAQRPRYFMFQYGGQDGAYFRGYTDQLNVTGTWYRLKILPSKAPNLNTLPQPLPASVVATLMSERMKRGGIILILGPAGAGKTHTAVSVVVSRLMKFGGVAFTLEDPVELPLNGTHGSGICFQGQVDGESPEAWTDAFRGILRSQPAGSTPMLLIGEIRDASAARAAIRAARNGFLVVTTSFGTTLIEGLSSFVTLAANSEEANHQVHCEALAGVLKIVVHQHLQTVGGDSVLAVQPLAFPENSSAVSLLRKGDIASLQGAIHLQANRTYMATSNGGTPIDLLQGAS